MHNSLPSYKNAKGQIPYNMTNDYMFRVILQKHPTILKALISALLHLNLESIQSANITNPIAFGEDIDDKTFVLDIDIILKNQKNGMVYSDKFSLSVIDLTCIELATSEDKVAHLDIWAKFFTSTTWEEVIMIAEYHPHIEAAAQALYEANADEMTKRKCRARRDYYKQKNTTEKMIHDLTESMEQKTKALEQISEELEQKSVELEQKSAELEQKDARIKELEALLASQNSH